MNNNEVTRQILGIVGMSYKNDYSASVEYKRGNVVVYDGSSYVAKKTTRGDLPTNSEYFQLIARKPIKGTDYFTQEDIDMMVERVTEDAESEFNRNVVEKTNEFNSNATSKTSAFDLNSEKKTSTFNENAGSKTSEFNTNAAKKASAYNSNAESRVSEFNTNASAKTTTFNSNATSKTNDYDANASTKLEAYNTNHTTKLNEYNTNASNKLSEYNTNAENKVEEFDEHVDELEERVEVLETVIDGLPKVEGEGTDIQLKNTIKSPLKMELDPSELEQETTKGNQLVDFNTMIGSFTFNNNILTVTTENAYSGVRIVITDLYKNNPGKILKFNYKNIDVSNQYGVPVQLYIYKTDNTEQYISMLTHDLIKTDVTIPNDTSAISLVQFQIRSNNVPTAQAASVTIEEPLLYFDDNDTYEPYTNGASPNPDYPQEVKRICGDNELKVQNRNLFNTKNASYVYAPSGITYSLDKSGYTINGTNSSTEFRIIGGYTNVTPTYKLPKGTYEFYAFLGDNRLTANIYVGNGNAIKVITNNRIVIDDEYKGLSSIKLTLPAGTYVNGKIKCLLKKIISNDTSYIGNEEQLLPLNLGVKNLFDKNNANVINGYLADDGFLTISSTYKSIIFNVKPNTTYAIKKILTKIFRVAEYETMPTLGSTYSNRIKEDNSTSIIYRTSNIGNYIVVNFIRDTDTLTEQEILDTIQIEEGSVAHSYSEYGVEPVEYCAIGDYKDEFFYNSSKREDYINTLENNKWYLKKNIGKAVFDGSERWGYDSSGEEGISVTNITLNDMLLGNYLGGLCKYFINKKTGKDKNTVRFGDGQLTRIYFYVDNTEYTSLDAWLDWISTHNIDTYYILATPQYILLNDTLQKQLTDIAKTLSYDEETNISQENEELPFQINASTLRDINSMFESLETRIAELETA